MQSLAVKTNPDAKISYKEMIKSNITSFREAVDIWNNTKFSAKKKSRNESKGITTNKENHTTEGCVGKILLLSFSHFYIRFLIHFLEW